MNSDMMMNEIKQLKECKIWDLYKIIISSDIVIIIFTLQMIIKIYLQKSKYE